MQNVAFIGLGNMGLPMAINLVKAGLTVTGFDMSAEARAGLVDAGGAVAVDAAGAVAGADVVITMLPNGKIVEAVYAGDDGVFAHAKEGALLIDSSTIDVATARRVAESAIDRGFEMLDAPVSGGVAGAAAGTLAFMVGGAELSFLKAQNILMPMAGKIVHAGGAGNGQAAKLCNNMLLAITMIGTSEAFNLSRALGVDDQTFFDIAANASGQSWSLTSYCPVPGPVPASPANRDYQPGFATALMLKDLGLATDALAETGVVAPLGSLSHEIYTQMQEADLGGTDFSGVINFLAEKAT